MIIGIIGAMREEIEPLLSFVGHYKPLIMRIILFTKPHTKTILFL